jgi:cystathionine gamma-synthase
VNNSLRHVPAGRPVPGSIHSVSVSIPDVAAVTGFESGDEATLRRISWGYPRFRVHPYVAQAAGLVAREGAGPGEDIVLTRSARAAAAAAAHAGLTPEAAFETFGLHGVRVPGGDVPGTRVREYVQHTGSHLSSREAEDILLDAGLIKDRQAEAALDDMPAETIRAVLTNAYGARDTGDVSLHNSVHAAVVQ